MILAAAMVAALATTDSRAQRGPPVFGVESVKSAIDCSTISFWGRWLLVECGDQFPRMKTSLQSALLESGRVRLATSKDATPAGTATLIVSASVSGLGMETVRASASDYCVAGTRVRGTMDYRVRSRHAAGPVIYGGTVTKSVEVTGHAVAGSNHCSAGVPSEADYRQLQGELALAAAREIVFKIEPLRVVALSGNGIVLNYGTPYVKLGDAVDVEDEFGVPVRFRISGAGDSRAMANPVGEGRNVAIAAKARLIEVDDPATNARRLDRVELP